MKRAGLYDTGMLRYLQPVKRNKLPVFSEWESISSIIKDRALEGFKSCDAYEHFCNIPSGSGFVRSSRNAYGQCLNTKTLFCTCCVFDSHDIVLNIMVAQCVNLFDTSLYEDGAVKSLIYPEALGELSFKQSLVDYASETYDWTQLVDRHLSRMHWMALHSEQERLLKEWTSFVMFVNTRENLVTINSDAITLWEDTLTPSTTPPPTQGFFLLRKDQTTQLIPAVIQRVRAFFTSIVIPFEIQLDEDYHYYQFGEYWAQHEIISSGKPEEELVNRLIILPEQMRRQVNACRIYSGKSLYPITHQHNLDHFTFANDPSTTSWFPLPEEIEACLECVKTGETKKIWWIPYHDDLSSYKRNALTTDILTYSECLTWLLFNHRFSCCTVEFLSEIEELGTFTIRVEVPTNELQVFFFHTTELFEENCIASSIEFKANLPKTSSENSLIFVRASDSEMIAF